MDAHVAKDTDDLMKILKRPAGSDVVFGKINTEEQRELGAEFQVRSIPMITIFREKIMLYHQPGALPPEALEDILGKVKELDMDDVRRQIAEAAQDEDNET